jgi:cytochrome b561
METSMDDNQQSVLISRATAVKHATATIVLHWGTVLAIVIAVATIYLRDFTEDDKVRQLLLDTHRQFGLLILIGVPARLLARFCLGFADQTRAMAALLRWVASATHVVLYASLIALPFIGWAATSAKAIPLSLFGLVRLPSLAMPDPDVADVLLDYHQWGAWALFGLVAVHALAALWHHFVRRDGVLSAMLPSHGLAWQHRLALEGGEQDTIRHSVVVFDGREPYRRVHRIDLEGERHHHRGEGDTPTARTPINAPTKQATKQR